MRHAQRRGRHDPYGAGLGFAVRTAKGDFVGRADWPPGRRPAPAAVPGTRAEIDYFGAAVPATVSEEPLFDPGMTRLRS